MQLLADPGQDSLVQVVGRPVRGFGRTSLLGSADTKPTNAGGQLDALPREFRDVLHQ